MTTLSAIRSRILGMDWESVERMARVAARIVSFVCAAVGVICLLYAFSFASVPDFLGLVGFSGLSFGLAWGFHSWKPSFRPSGRLFSLGTKLELLRPLEHDPYAEEAAHIKDESVVRELNEAYAIWRKEIQKYEKQKQSVRAQPVPITIDCGARGVRIVQQLPLDKIVAPRRRSGEIPSGWGVKRVQDLLMKVQHLPPPPPEVKKPRTLWDERLERNRLKSELNEARYAMQAAE